MFNYQLVEQSKEEIEMVNSLQYWSEHLKSERYRGEISDALCSYNAGKRLKQFKALFNAPCPHPTISNAFRFDDDESAPMLPGYFSSSRVATAFTNGRCLICGTENLDLCKHRAVIDDCIKANYSRYDSRLHTTGRYKHRLNDIRGWDKIELALEAERKYIPDFISQGREWRKSCAEAKKHIDCLEAQETFRCKCVALGMGLVPRLGEFSPTNVIDPEIFSMTVDLCE